MSKQQRIINSYVLKFASLYDKAYHSWAIDNVDKFPMLFKNPKRLHLCELHQHAGRVAFILISHTAQNIWSNAAGLMLRENSLGNTRHVDTKFANTAFLTSETARLSYSLTQMLSFKACRQPCLLTNDRTIAKVDYIPIAKQLYSYDGRMWRSYTKMMNDKFGLVSRPIKEFYIPLEIREEVFKSLLSRLYSKFKDLATAEQNFDILKQGHETLSSYISMVSFKSLNNAKPNDSANKFSDYLLENMHS